MKIAVRLEDSLVREITAIVGCEKRTEAVELALRDYAARQKRIKILSLVGRVEYFDDVDHKQIRARRKR